MLELAAAEQPPASYLRPDWALAGALEQVTQL